MRNGLERPVKKPRLEIIGKIRYFAAPAIDEHKDNEDLLVNSPDPLFSVWLLSPYSALALNYIIKNSVGGGLLINKSLQSM